MSDGARRLRFTRSAQKELRRLDPQDQRRVLEAIDRLSTQDPSLDVRRLTGSEQSRIRVGDLRVIFEDHGQEQEILIRHVLPRSRAYRR